MSALGSLVVKLALEYAEYTQGLSKSDQEALKFAQNAQRHFDTAANASKEFFVGVVKGAVAAGAAYIGVSATIEKLKSSIDTLAKLDDMAQKTGSSVENLSRLQKVASAFGQGFDDVDSSLNKLAKGIATVDDESNKTNKALAALGISSKDTAGKLRDPSEVMVDVAKRLQNYRDGAAKAALVTDLFGKSGANLLPYLNDLADNVDRFTGVSKEAAKAAADLQDRFGLMRVKSEELWIGIAGDLIPAVSDVIDLFSRVRTESENTARSGNLATWAEDLTVTFVALANTVDNMVTGIRLAGAAAAKIAADVAISSEANRERDAIAPKNFLGFRKVAPGSDVEKKLDDIDARANARHKAVEAEYDRHHEAILSGVDRFNRNYAKLKEAQGIENDPEIKRLKARADAAKAALNYTTGNPKGAEKNDFDALNKAIEKRIALAEEEIKLGRPLAEAEKELADLRRGVEGGAIKLTKAEQALLERKIKTLSADDMIIKRRKDQEKADKELVDAEMKKLDALQQSLEKAEEELYLYGQLPSVITAATVAKMEARLATLKLVEGTESESAATMAQISLLEQQIEVQKKISSLQGSKESKDAAKKLSDQWKHDFDRIEDWIGDAIGRGVTKGKNVWKSLIDGIEASFARLVLSPIIQPIAAFGASFLNPGAAQAQGTAGGLIQGASLFSSGKTMWDGFASGAASMGNGAAQIAQYGSTMFGGTAPVSTGMAGTGWVSAEGSSAYLGSGASAVGTAAPYLGYGGLGIMAGQAISNGYGNSASVYAGAAGGAAIGMQIGSIGGPMGMMIGAIIGGVLNRAFGSKQVGSGVIGDVSGDSFTGSSYVFKRGGWLSSDKTQTSAMEKNASAAFDAGVREIYDSYEQLGHAVGAGTDLLKDYKFSFRMALADFDDAGRQKETQRLLSAMTDSMAMAFVDSFRTSVDTAQQAASRYWTNTIDGARTFTGGVVEQPAVSSKLDPYISDIIRIFDAQRAGMDGVTGAEGKLAAFTTSLFGLGSALVENQGYLRTFGEALDFKKLEEAAIGAETVLDTFTRLNSVFGVTNSLALQLGKNVDTAFGAVGLASTEARERLVSLAGGADALAAGSAFFAENFLSSEARLKPAIQQVDEVLDKLGWSGIRTKEQFVALRQSLDLSTEAGARAFVQLLNIQEAYLEIANSTAGAGSPLNLMDAVNAAHDILKRSVESQRDIVTHAYESAMDRLQTSLDGVNTRIGKLSNLSGALKSTLDRMTIAGMAGADYAEAQAKIQTALAIARAGGPLPPSESIARALDVVSQPNEAAYKTFLDFQREQILTKNSIQELSGMTDVQLSIEDQTLQSIKDQIKVTENGYQAEMKRFDDLLSSAQAQIDALNGIDTTVKSIADAILGFNKASAAAGGGLIGGATGIPSVVGDVSKHVDILYNSILGRTPDAEGMAYWSNLINNGTPIFDVVNAIRNSDEYKTKYPAFAGGGDHLGGIALVGEQGPELINTGPARIFNAGQTTSILNGRGNVELIAEIRSLRATVERQQAALDKIERGTTKTKDILVNVTRDGNALLTEPA